MTSINNNNTLQENSHLPYFESIASKNKSYRKNHSYYWNEITRYCDYFSHDDYAVLEIGCGTGELIHQIKGKKKTGIDFSPAMIDVAKQSYTQPHIDFHVMEAENITLTDKYDLIILSNIISYIGDLEHVFTELHKVCHENTKVIVNYHNYLWQPFLKFAENIGLKRKTPEQNWLSRDDVSNLLYLSGFDTFRTSMRMILPINIPLISYIFNKFLVHLPIFRHTALNLYTFAKRSEPTPYEDYSHKYVTSIVIPARNESGNIENALLRMPRFGKDLEIIFIEGNSTDDTWAKIQEIADKYKDQFNIKIGQQTGKGKGDAVRKGFAMATGDILTILDADLTMPPEDLPKFYDAIASGKGDFVNGCRLVYRMEKKAMRPLNL